MEIEQLLAHCGDFGRYQMLLLALFCLINVLASINYYSQTIITFVPEHWCYSESLADKTIDQVRDIYANYTNPHCTPFNATSTGYGGYDDFRHHDANAASVELKSLLMYGTLAKSNLNSAHASDNETDLCKRWIYNLDYGYESMSSDLNWVCQNAWQSTIGQSMFFVGSVIGSLVFGILADKIGRLRVLIVANLMAMFGNAFTVFCSGPWSFAACRFVAGLATDSNFVMMYILVMEYIRPSMRTVGLNLCIGLFYCVGSMVTPWIAVLVGDWRTYLIVTSMPVVLVPFFYFWVEESALWLLSRNEVDSAIGCFERVAKTNGRTLSADVVEQFRKGCLETIDRQQQQQGGGGAKSGGESANLLDLFRTPRLRKSTLILFFKSMVITLSYDAISRNVDGLGVTPFVMFTLSAMAIFPACIVLLMMQDRIGRKAMASSSLLISGVFTAATGIIIAYQQGVRDPNLLVTLAIFGRFGVTVAYNSAAQYATELIPTCVRGQGVAAVHVAGYALTFFSSYILYLNNIWLALPPLILGFLCLAGSFLVLFLPETLNRTIPSTLADGEAFGKGERLFYFSCCGSGSAKSAQFDKELNSNTRLYDSQTTIATNA